MPTTHEPEKPLEGFPYSHVKVDDVFFDSCDECVKVTIHGTQHYLHRTTAFSLYEQLRDYFKNLSDPDKLLLTLGGIKLDDNLI